MTKFNLETMTKTQLVNKAMSFFPATSDILADAAKIERIKKRTKDELIKDILDLAKQSVKVAKEAKREEAKQAREEANAEKRTHTLSNKFLAGAWKKESNERKVELLKARGVEHLELKEEHLKADTTLSFKKAMASCVDSAEVQEAKAFALARKAEIEATVADVMEGF